MISILLPVFNATPFLSDCLRSIQGQTYTNWELLAVDDYSRDDSRDILNDFAQKDDRIKIFSNTEKGIIPALSVAFQNSRGNYVTRMDADDLMPPQKLELLLAALQKKGPGFVCTGKVKYFSQGSLGDGYQKYQHWLNQLVDHQNHFQSIYRECVLPSPAWLVHRSDLINAGAFQSKQYPEDYDLCFRFYQAGLSIFGINEMVHLWRDHAHRTSRNSPIYANQHYLDLKLPYFLKLNLDNHRPLVLWGAGKKGKIIAQYFHKHQVPFHWITDNPRKQGITIHHQQLRSVAYLDTLIAPQVIIAIATPTAQTEIKEILASKPDGTAYWFC